MESTTLRKFYVTDEAIDAMCLSSDMGHEEAEDRLRRALLLCGAWMVRPEPKRDAQAAVEVMPLNSAREVRMQIISEMMRTGAYSASLVVEADAIAQYVLTGKKPGAEG